MATARVRLIAEIDVRSCWGADCSIEQVEKQATEEALGAINRALRDRVTIIGSPEVTLLIIPAKVRG